MRNEYFRLDHNYFCGHNIKLKYPPDLSAHKTREKKKSGRKKSHKLTPSAYAGKARVKHAFPD